jgi:hypothetical protein
MIIFANKLLMMMILAVFWVSRPQNPLSVSGQKNLFCVNFGQEWHLPPQHPGFGLKLSLKGKPGTCPLLETLQSPVDFFLARKACRTATQILYSAYIIL